MIADAERNYETHSWQLIDGIPPGSTSLSMMEMYYFCNSDSQRFKDIIAQQKTDKLWLLDYELIELGFDPTQGSMLYRSPGGKIILMVFSEGGRADTFIEI